MTMILEYWIGAVYFINETAWFWLIALGMALFAKMFEVLYKYSKEDKK